MQWLVKVQQYFLMRLVVFHIDRPNIRKNTYRAMEKETIEANPKNIPSYGRVVSCSLDVANPRAEIDV